jgi:uncharacterized protein with ParB-like and HNH nuclease domain
MSTIVPYYRTIQTLLQSRAFGIDEYQREYKWEEKEINELISDLQEKFLSCYTPGDSTTRVAEYEDYFLGSIIVSKRGTKHFLVDGQQRVTSLTLLLIYLYRTAKKDGVQVVERIAPLIFSDNFGERAFNLDILERRAVLDALFKGAPFDPTGKEESIQTMYARYADIEEADLKGELGEGFVHFIYWLLAKVGLIEISTDNDAYAYSIFETMNDRGKPLSPVDMLKAYLLAPIEDNERRKQANQTWKKEVLELISAGGEQEQERDANCIKAWFRAQYADSIRERKAKSKDKDWELLSSAFHRWTRDNHERIGLNSEAANFKFVTEHFPFFAKAYKLIAHASEVYTPGLESIYYNHHNGFTWQSTVLLAPLEVTDDDATVRRKLAITATYIDIWLMRRVVNYVRVAYNHVSYAMYLLCKEIRRKPVNELAELLSEKLVADEIDFGGYEQKGRYGILGLGLNQFSKRYVYHLLARLMRHVEVGSDRPDRFPEYVDRTSASPFDIEHILPAKMEQDEAAFGTEQEYLETRDMIGALLLLPADVNRSLQDKPYPKKLPAYAQQNLFAASLASQTYSNQPRFTAFLGSSGSELHAYDRFGRQELDERTTAITQLVEQIWSVDRIRKIVP